jgi:hypothetical protein
LFTKERKTKDVLCQAPINPPLASEKPDVRVR